MATQSLEGAEVTIATWQGFSFVVLLALLVTVVVVFMLFRVDFMRDLWLDFMWAKYVCNCNCECNYLYIIIHIMYVEFYFIIFL